MGPVFYNLSLVLVPTWRELPTLPNILKAQPLTSLYSWVDVSLHRHHESPFGERPLATGYGIPVICTSSQTFNGRESRTRTYIWRFSYAFKLLNLIFKQIKLFAYRCLYQFGHLPICFYLTKAK
jgi:hypothetical protein